MRNKGLGVVICLAFVIFVLVWEATGRFGWTPAP